MAWRWIKRRAARKGYDPRFYVEEKAMAVILAGFLALGIYLTINPGSGY